MRLIIVAVILYHIFVPEDRLMEEVCSKVLSRSIRNETLQQAERDSQVGPMGPSR